MPIANIRFTTVDGRIGIIPANEDGISGMIWHQSGTQMTPGLFIAGAIDRASNVVAAAAQQSVTLDPECVYQIREYFRQNPLGKLYFMTQPPEYVTGKIAELQNFAGGKIRQIGLGGDFDDNDDLDDLVARVAADCEELFTNKKPLVALIEHDRTNFAPIVESVSPTIDLNAPALLNSNRFVAVITGGEAGITEDDGTTPLPVFGLGTALGRLAITPVGDCIGAGTAQLSDGSAYTALQISDIPYEQIPDGALNEIDDLKVIFPRTIVGVDGAFFNNDYTLAAIDSDYRTLARCRVIQKSLRVLNTVWAPYVNVSFLLDLAGTINLSFIGEVKARGEVVLEQMKKNKEISNYEIVIDPAQDTVTSEIFTIQVRIQPKAKAKFIDVELGFTVSV